MPRGIYDRSKMKRKTRTKELLGTDKTLVRSPTHIRYKNQTPTFTSSLTQVHIDSYTAGFKKGFEEAVRILKNPSSSP